MSAKAAMPPTTSGATPSASTKATAGGPPTQCETNQAITAPSMKNSPCATLTTRMIPKTSDNPLAVSARTEALTSPSRRARRKMDPRLTQKPGGTVGPALLLQSCQKLWVV